MELFYSPDIADNHQLPESEAHHCLKVMRMQTGDTIFLTDGKGYFYRAEIGKANVKDCVLHILEVTEQAPLWKGKIEIALAPAKNMERTEWFAEKATEIGIDKISFLHCRYSERKEIKTERIQKILVSAMKQSGKAGLPELQEISRFNHFVEQDFDGQKFIAHCYPEEKKCLSKVYRPNENALILIGPEGDFSKEEVDLAVKHGFIPISLGSGKLRTETAALVACHTIHIVNQIQENE
jgi:16S rRNA (uracil1498-N3)-methyltransferase